MPGINSKLKELAKNVRNTAYATTELAKPLLLLVLGFRSLRRLGTQAQYKQ